MPSAGGKPSVADQINAAMKAAGIESNRDLARRVLPSNATKEQWEAKRRSIQKMRSGETKRPTRKTLSPLERELGLPEGGIVVPPPEQVRAERATAAQLLRRLQLLEERDAEREDQLRTLAVRTTAQLVALGGDPVTLEPQESRRETDGNQHP